MHDSVVRSPGGVHGRTSRTRGCRWSSSHLAPCPHSPHSPHPSASNPILLGAWRLPSPIYDWSLCTRSLSGLHSTVVCAVHPLLSSEPSLRCIALHFDASTSSFGLPRGDGPTPAVCVPRASGPRQQRPEPGGRYNRSRGQGGQICTCSHPKPGDGACMQLRLQRGGAKESPLDLG